MSLALALFCAWPAQAKVISTMHSSARALGMGDAFTALAADSSALYYNPAGLARVGGLNWKILSFRAGASGVDAYPALVDLQGSSGSGFASAINGLMGKGVWTNVGGETAFTAPMFGFAIYNHLDALVRFDNPVNPNIYTSIVNDYGYSMGLGIPIGPFLEWGMTMKYIKRTGARMPMGASAIADLDPAVLVDRVSGWGRGYGFDTGVNAIIPLPIFTASLGVAWKNVGRTEFRSSNRQSYVPAEDNDITLGAAFVFDTTLLTITPAIDVRYVNDPDYQLMRKINFGIEIGLPLLDIRGGFHEGYYTAGIGLDMGLFQLDAATYGVELGAYPGQIEDRRYMVEFAMEIGVGSFTASSSALSNGNTGSGASSGGGGGGSSGGSGKGGSKKSIWGGSRKLKQRR